MLGGVGYVRRMTANVATIVAMTRDVAVVRPEAVLQPSPKHSQYLTAMFLVPVLSMHLLSPSMAQLRNMRESFSTATHRAKPGY